jgi:hypothetical protein
LSKEREHANLNRIGKDGHGECGFPRI